MKNNQKDQYSLMIKIYFPKALTTLLSTTKFKNNPLNQS